MANNIRRQNRTRAVTSSSRPSAPARKFMSRAKKVRTEWAERTDVFAGGSVEEAPKDWFRRTAYRYLKAVVIKHDSKIFDEIIDRSGRRTAGRYDLGDQPFKKGLMAMFPDANGLTRDLRMDWGDQFEYAYRHSVLSKYLNGFIKQAGSVRVIRKKLKDNHVEPGFEVRPPA